MQKVIVCLAFGLLFGCGTVSTPPGSPTQPESRKPRSSEPPSTLRPEVANQIRRYMDENFGVKGYETTWYSAIKHITVDGKTVIVETDQTYPSEKAKGVCSGISGFVWSSENRSLGLENIRIVGAKIALFERVGLSGRCR